MLLQAATTTVLPPCCLHTTVSDAAAAAAAFALLGLSKLAPGDGASMEAVVRAGVPLGRMGDRSDIALACVFLASSAGRCAARCEAYMLCAMCDKMCMCKRSIVLA